MTDEDDRGLWAESAREAFRASRDALVAAILEESNAILAATSLSDEDLDRSTDVVYAAGVRYSESHYELTGFYGIAGVWDEESDEEDDEIDADHDDRPAKLISVLQRSDYEIQDPAAVLASGRSTWLEDYPDASEKELFSHVGHLGGSLYAIAHKGGWEHLERVDGICPIGAIAKAISPSGYDGTWLDEVDWANPASGFEVAGEVLYSQADRW